MNADSWDVIKQIDPRKKDAHWISKVTSRLRMDWRALVTRDRAAINKSYLFSQQDLCDLINSFKDKQFKRDTKFIPLGIWNRILNILIEEIRKMPPKVQLKANDAMAEIEKNNDVELFKLKEFHEQNINKINRRVGEVDEFIGDDKFKSNILSEFKRLNLDPKDPEDINFFQQNDFPRLKFEEAGQKLLNIIFKENRFDQERIMDYVIDALSTYCICQQTYVDEMTGQILFDHISPEEAFGVWSDRRDGSNDTCQGWLKNITVREFLGRVGNKFIWDRDWSQLLWAINYCNNTKYTGFIRNGVTYSINGADYAGMAAQGSLPSYNNGWATANLDWSLAYTYKVYAGYIEFSSIDATATYLEKVDSGEMLPNPIDLDYFLDESKETKEYEKVSYYNEQMYKTYFLATSNITQWIYNWGKVYMQQLEGAYDQFAKGTLMYYRMEGTCPVDISKFYIDFANLTAYRMKWIVYHSKPEKEQYVIEELIKVSKQMQRMFPQSQQSKAPTIDTILMQLINWKRENFVDVRSYPEIEGKTYPILAPQKGDTGGRLDPLALGLQAVEQWAEMQIAEKIGLNDLRLGQVQNEREGYKQNMAEMESSYNSTGYLFRMIQYMKEYTARTTLNYAQDIVRFKDTIPYKWLLKLVGELQFENLKLLEDFAAHRYAIIIQDYNTAAEKNIVRQSAMAALNARDGAAGISYPEFLMILGEEDWRKAGRMLAYFQYKQEKKTRKQKLQELQIAQQSSMQQKAMEGKMQQQKDQAMIQGKMIDAKAVMYTADKSKEGKVETKILANQNEVPKNLAQQQKDEALMEKENELKQQHPLGT